MEQINKSGYKILSITIPKTVFEYDAPKSENSNIEIDLNISTTHQILQKIIQNHIQKHHNSCYYKFCFFMGLLVLLWVLKQR